MLSVNGIIVCVLILGVVLMGLIFTSLADTDLIIADPSSKSKNETQSDRFRTATKAGLLLTDISPDMHERLSDGLLGESDVGGSGPSGKVKQSVEGSRVWHGQ